MTAHSFLVAGIACALAAVLLACAAWWHTARQDRLDKRSWDEWARRWRA